MEDKEIGTIREVPTEEAGVIDGVETMAMCSVSDFEVENGQVTGIAGIAIAPCKIMASYENGIVSVSVRGEEHFMVSVRMDEMMALLQAASARAIEAREKGNGKK